MPTIETIQVLVLCRDPLVRAGLTATLRDHPGFALVNGDLPLTGRVGVPPGPAADVVVADYEHGLGRIAPVRPDTLPCLAGTPAVLIVTQRDGESEIRRALELGARGYLVLGCGVDELLDAVRTVHRGMRYLGVLAARRLADSVACSPLTGRETDVLRLVALGRGNKAIARHLGVAVGTVKSHLKAIFGKLDANSRTEVAAIAQRRGLVEHGPSGVRAGTGAPRGAGRTTAGPAIPVAGAAFAHHRAINGTAESQAFITNLHALQRVASPEERARSVHYLAAADSAFVTGRTSLVDGGVSITQT